MDSVARAYAILGLTAATPAAEVRCRYRGLVKRWHPDRFANDPWEQAEAATRMREINDAFGRIVQSWSSPPADRTPSVSRPPGARLSREEVERMVQGIGTEGPVDWLLDAFRVDWGRAADRWVVHFQIALGLYLVADIARQWVGIGNDNDPSRWWNLLVIVGGIAILRRVHRKKRDS